MMVMVVVVVVAMAMAMMMMTETLGSEILRVLLAMLRVRL